MNGNLGVVPSAEYNVSNSRTHRDYVELAWRSNGSSFDLEYFEESGNSFCSTLLDEIFQFGIIQNFPCTLTGELTNISTQLISNFLQVCASYTII